MILPTNNHCDQVLELKVTAIFQQLTKNRPNHSFLKSDIHHNSPKSCQIFGLL